jgi:putative ABC transport system ATP-binding protein
MTDAVVEISNLNHWFGEGDLRRHVLRDLTLSVPVGRTTYLMGPSGCGKTTLLTIVGALRSVMSGSVRIAGQELSGISAAGLVAIRRQIGFVFQHHNLHRSLTVYQNVRMGLEVKGEVTGADTRDRIMDILTAVGIADQADKMQDRISGGQKQRAAIARALVGAPLLLLADEPTAALDGKTGRSVIEMMRRLTQDRGMSMLMVTHDNRILDLADHIFEMDDGRLLMSRTATAVPVSVGPTPTSPALRAV